MYPCVRIVATIHIIILSYGGHMIISYSNRTVLCPGIYYMADHTTVAEGIHTQNTYAQYMKLNNSRLYTLHNAYENTFRVFLQRPRVFLD